jgi:hypothetical protein
MRAGPGFTLLLGQRFTLLLGQRAAVQSVALCTCGRIFIELHSEQDCACWLA